MSSGLYSGVSGLALGTGLYRDVSGLWSGASGLIAGFDGGNPYSGASLYLDFLTMTAPTFDSRITFSRGSNATLTDSTGKITYAPNNLLTYSQEFDNAAWTKSNATVTANATTAPDGTVTADKLVENTASAQHYVQQMASLSAASHVMSFYAKQAERNFVVVINTTGTNQFGIFNLATGAVSSVGTGATASIQSVGNGWYRCLIIFAATAGSNTFRIYPALDASTTVYTGDGTSGIFIWGAQLEPVTYQTTPSTYQATTSSAYYGPRFDYDPVTLAARGLLIEEQRTNLLTFSEQFDNAAWGKFLSASVTANTTTAPDGTTTADTLTLASTTNSRIEQTVTVASGQTYTFSVWMRVAAGTLSVRLYGIDTGAGSAFTVNTSWQRFSITQVASSGTRYPAIVTDGTAGSVFIWGAQLEAGSFATSYIPTVASQVTRNADVASMTGTNFSSWYNQASGTFVFEGSSFTVPSFSYPLLASDNSFANRFGIYTSSSSAAGLVVSSSVTQMDITASSVVANVPFKAAVAAQTNSGNFSLNGSIGTTDTTITMPVVNRLTIGAGFVGTGEYINGHIRSIAYYNTRLSNSQLQTLTT